MALTIDEVKHIATLSRIELTEDEMKKYQVQLSHILEYITQLNEIDTSLVEPTINTTGISDRMRADHITPSLPKEDVLKNAATTNGEFFIVPSILPVE